MEGKIVIKATHHSDEHSNLQIECRMSKVGMIDRFNLMCAVGQALEFDDKDWFILGLFRNAKDKLQTEESVSLDLGSVEKFLSEDDDAES